MSNIDLDVQENIAVVTLKKQPVNIFDKEYYKEFKDFMEELNNRNDYNVVIIKSGCRHFSGGGDLQEIKEINTYGDEVATEVSKAACAAMNAVYMCKKPVIAAVNGNAIGSGAAIAACCDIIIAEETSKFLVPEINVGFIGASEFMELLLPRKLARYYVYTGRAVTGKDLIHFGSVLTVCTSKEDVWDKAYEIARDIASKAPMAITLFKEAMHYNDNECLKEKYLHEMDLGVARFYKTEDAKEAVNAAIEKRNAVFTGQ